MIQTNHSSHITSAKFGVFRPPLPSPSPAIVSKVTQKAQSSSKWTKVSQMDQGGPNWPLDQGLVAQMASWKIQKPTFLCDALYTNLGSDDYDTGSDEYGDDHDGGGADFQPWPDQSRILRLQLIGSDINIVYHCTSSSYLFTFGKGKQFLIAKTAFKNLILQKNPYFSGGLLC